MDDSLSTVVSCPNDSPPADYYLSGNHGHIQYERFSGENCTGTSEIIYKSLEIGCNLAALTLIPIILAVR
jgi:hypothetical protein